MADSQIKLDKIISTYKNQCGPTPMPLNTELTHPQLKKYPHFV